MSDPLMNRTLPATVLPSTKNGPVLSTLLDIDQKASTEFKRYKFQQDPWSLKARNNVELKVLQNINLTLALTQSTNKDPVSYFVLTYSVLTHYSGSPSFSLHLFDQNDANVLDFKLSSLGGRCNNTDNEKHLINFDPKYWDIIEGGILVVGASTWKRC